MMYSILFLALSWVTVANSDPVNFHIQINCDPSVEEWCGTVVVYEEDGVSDHDKLKEEAFCTTNVTKALDYKLYPGGDFSPSYEIKYTLTHNCTIDSLTRCITPEAATDVSVFGETKANFQVDAYQMGETRACKEINGNDPYYN